MANRGSVQETRGTFKLRRFVKVSGLNDMFPGNVVQRYMFFLFGGCDKNVRPTRGIKETMGPK